MAAINIIELKPIYDSAKSFYKKARVRSIGSSKTLVSYQTDVMRYDNGRLTRAASQPQSATTVRHMREWAQQLGYPRMSKAELLALPTFWDVERGALAGVSRS